MFDENQLVEVMWSNKTRKWFESKEYLFTEYGDKFLVKAKDLSNSSGKRIKVICDYCGKEYAMTYCGYNKREDKTKDVCSQKCRALKQYDNSKEARARYQFDKVRTICEMYNYELLTAEEEFTTTHMDIKFICQKHGLQKMMLDNFTHGHKCYFCSYEERADNLRHSIEYVQSVIESCNNNKWLNPECYVNALEKNLQILCGSCGGTYITSFDAYTAKDKQKIKCFSCSCKESKGESRIREFLEQNHIMFEQEKIFDDCKDVRSLPFDFYLPKYNLIIEFDGQHHFYEVGFGNFESTQKHDKIKNQYCKNNNIGLLRISYLDGNDIEKIIAKQLNL